VKWQLEQHEPVFAGKIQIESNEIKLGKEKCNAMQSNAVVIDSVFASTAKI